MASRTCSTQALASGPSAVTVVDRDDEDEGEDVADEDDVAEVVSSAEVGDDVEEELVLPAPGSSEAHPTRARTARPAAARVR